MAITSAQSNIVVVSTIFPMAALIVVALRLRARVMTSEKIKADDWFIVAGAFWVLISMFPYLFGAFTACAGVHITDCSIHRQYRFLKVTWSIQMLYLVCNYCVKVSLLLFFRRLFPARRFGQVILAAVAFVTAWVLAFFFATLFQRLPVSANWSDSPATHSLDEERMNKWLCATNVFADVVILILPVPMILGLKMDRKNKVALLAIFSLGIFTCITSAMRLKYVLRYIKVDSNVDETWLLADVIVWSCLEPCLGILCACLPLLHPFFKRHSPEKIVAAHRSLYAPVKTTGEADGRPPRNEKELEEFSSRVANFHENVID